MHCGIAQPFNRLANDLMVVRPHYLAQARDRRGNFRLFFFGYVGVLLVRNALGCCVQDRLRFIACFDD
jgi:hypothetical protein